MKFKDYTQEEKKEYLNEAKQLCELLSNYNPHLGFGSLLAAVRGGKLIEGDYDIDICVETKEPEKVFDFLLKKGLIARYFYSNGEKWIDNPKELPKPFGQAHIKIGKHTIDLFIVWIENGDYHTCQWGNLGKHKGYKSAILNKVKFNIPKNYDEILTTLYRDWRTPSNDHPSKYLTRRCYLKNL
jgi:phosphorylcholine metabolism protein LicD